MLSLETPKSTKHYGDCNAVSLFVVLQQNEIWNISVFDSFDYCSAVFIGDQENRIKCRHQSFHSFII